MKTGETERFPSLDDGQWDEILDLGLKQGVTGLLFSGASSLSDDIIIPHKTAIRLMMETDRILRRSEKVSKAADSLMAALKTKGLNPSVMKGPSAATLYPEPKLRESGDLDIFLPPSEFEKAIEVVAPVFFRKDPDGNILYLWDGIEIDQHPRYFDLHCNEESKLGKRLLSLIPFDGAPSPEAQFLMLSLHIRKHCMSTGVGLRQICDMAMAYKAFQGRYDPQNLLELYNVTGSGKWNRLLGSFIRTYLGDIPLPYSDDTNLPTPEPLFKIVFSGGSFGHYDPSRKGALKKGGHLRKFDTLVRILRRLPFSLRYSESEFIPFLNSLIKGNLA